MGYRYIKWVGERAVLKSDGFSVANWKHENRRRYPIPFPPGSPGNISRVVQTRELGGITRDYVWDRNSPDWTIPIQDRDAQLILQHYGHEFRDVTDVKDWASVQNHPLILPKR
jgi:hypothetical protein